MENFSLLRELQISPWPIAPSNFSPLWFSMYTYVGLFWRIFWWIVWQIFLQFFSTNFFWKFLLTFNLSTIARFSIGLPSILFFHELVLGLVFSRIDWCEEHGCGSTYMVMRLSHISSKRAKNAFFVFLCENPSSIYSWSIGHYLEHEFFF